MEKVAPAKVTFPPLYFFVWEIYHYLIYVRCFVVVYYILLCFTVFVVFFCALMCLMLVRIMKQKEEFKSFWLQLMVREDKA